MQRSIVVAMIGLMLVVVGCGSGSPLGEGTKTVGNEQATTTEPPKETKLGTRDNPVPIGTKVNIGKDWQATLKTVNKDATTVIQAENQFNKPPAAGKQFVMGTFLVTYVGPKTGKPYIDLSFKFVGSGGNTFSTGTTDSCGVVPNSMNDVGEMFANASSEGNVCISVPAAQIAGGAFIVEQSLTQEPSRVFFDLK